MAFLRRATAEDAAAIAILHRATVRAALSFLPELHTAEEDLAFFSDAFLPANEVWVAEIDGAIAGYVGFDAQWINHLFVAGDFQGQGLGPALLAKALADGQAKRLWTFQKNARARTFYEDRGFVLLELTNGAGNEENEPDALYEWRP
jgi:putative acetyltransferase